MKNPVDIMKFSRLLFLTLLAFLVNPVFATSADLANNYTQLSDEKLETAIEIKKYFSEIDQQVNNKILTQVQAEGARLFVLAHHQSQMVQPLPLDKLRELARSCMEDEHCRKKSIMNSFRGFFSFVNIMWFIASMLILAGIFSMLIAYKEIVLHVLEKIKSLTYKLWQPCGKILYGVAKFLKSIPVLFYVLFYELLLVLMTLTVIGLAQFSSEASQSYIAFIGNALFMLASLFLFFRNRKPIDEFFKKYSRYLPINPSALLMAMIVVVLAVSTIFYQSQLLGFFTIALLLIWLGFGVMSYSFGFKDRKYIVRNGHGITSRFSAQI